MKNLFNGSRISVGVTNRIYVSGNYLKWYNEDEDWLEQDCPLVYRNLDLISIDEEGLVLEQKGTLDLLNDGTWCLYETDCTGKKENFINSVVLRKELGIKVLILTHTNKILEKDCPMPIWGVYTEEEFDRFEKDTDYEDWQDISFTEITSIILC